MEALSGELEKLRLSSSKLDGDAGWIDSIAGEQRPPKRQRKTKKSSNRNSKKSS
jgi:antiviral helicase SKI2